MEHFCELECLNTAVGSLIKKSSAGFQRKIIIFHRNPKFQRNIELCGICSGISTAEFQWDHSSGSGIPMNIPVNFCELIGQCLDSALWIDSFLEWRQYVLYNYWLLHYVGLPFICFISFEKLVCDNYYGTERNAILLNPIK